MDIETFRSENSDTVVLSFSRLQVRAIFYALKRWEFDWIFGVDDFDGTINLGLFSFRAWYKLSRFGLYTPTFKMVVYRLESPLKFVI